MTATPSGPQFGVKYTLTGPTGEVAVFNDSTDPNYVGLIKEITGLDGAEVRENAENVAGMDGGVHGDFWYGRRPITITGEIHDMSNTTQRNEKMTKLKLASAAMRGNSILSWTPDGGEEQFVEVRRAAPPRISGAWVKQFQLALVSAEPFIQAKAKTEQTVAVAYASGTATGTTPKHVLSVENFVYVCNSGGNNVSVFKLEEGSKVKLIQTIAAGTGPLYITGDIANVYVVNGTAKTVSKYTRNETTGELTALGSAAAVGTVPKAVVSAPFWVAVVNESSITMFKRNTETGELTLSETKEGEGSATKTLVDGCNPTPSNYALLTINESEHKLITWTVSVEATLTKLGAAVETPEVPQAMAFSKKSKGSGIFLAVACKGHYAGFEIAEISGKATSLGNYTAESTQYNAVTIALTGNELIAFFASKEKGVVQSIPFIVPGESTWPSGPLQTVSLTSPQGLAFGENRIFVINSTESKLLSIPLSGRAHMVVPTTELTCVNKGSGDAYPIIELVNETGELTDPVIWSTNGALVFSGLSISPGQTLVIDNKNRTALLNGTSVYGYLNFGASTWFTLGPGSTVIAPSAGSFTKAKLKISFRSAWE